MGEGENRCDRRYFPVWGHDRGWRAKRCRAVQRKVTGEEEGGWHRPAAWRWPGWGSAGGIEHLRGETAVAVGSGALFAGLGATGGDSRGGVGERPRGLPAAAAALSAPSLRNKYEILFFLLCNLPRTLSKDGLDFPLARQPGRRGVWLCALSYGFSTAEVL